MERTSYTERLRSQQNKIAFALVAILVLYMVGRPALNTWRADNATVAADQTQARQLNTEAAGAARFNQAGYHTAIRYYQAEIPASEDLPKVINEINALTGAAKLQWTSGSPSSSGRTIQGAPSGQWTLAITVQGNVAGVTRFLSSLSTSQPLIVADSVALNGPPDNVAANITLRFFAQKAGS